MLMQFTGTNGTRESSKSAPQGAQIAPAKSGIDSARIEFAVREILLAIGENPAREGLRDTPKRVAKAYAELFAGLREDAGEHLRRVFEHDTGPADQVGDLVVVRDIEFFSLCEHHLLPFLGRAHVAYLPAGGRVVGLSKLARTVDVFARRPQMQERLTSDIAGALMEHLSPKGAAVIVEGEHMCMKMRGVCKHQARMVTSAFRGSFADDRDLRAEVSSLLTGGQHGR